MKNFFKNLALVFKNKNSTAQALWGAVGAPKDCKNDGQT